jgi:hypothetical protein
MSAKIVQADMQTETWSKNLNARPTLLMFTKPKWCRSQLWQDVNGAGECIDEGFMVKQPSTIAHDIAVVPG